MHSISSFAKRSNKELKKSKATTNSGVVRAAKINSGVILLGGTSNVDFQVRVAQRRMRRDVMPSFWSDAMILVPDGTIYGISLNDVGDINEVACGNGIREYQVRDFNSVKEYPNFALISFSKGDYDVSSVVASAKQKRASFDIPGLLVKWLGYVWGVEGYGNPVNNNLGLPSATLVEVAYADAGLDLTPGLVTQACSPEAIWQAAKWWQDYYKESDGDDDQNLRPCVPRGAYAIRGVNPTISE